MTRTPNSGLDGRLERMEEIVRLLDSDSLGLDEALALFEEGIGHLRRAQEILATAELRIEELVGPQGDEVRNMPIAQTSRSADASGGSDA